MIVTAAINMTVDEYYWYSLNRIHSEEEVCWYDCCESGDKNYCCKIHNLLSFTPYWKTPSNHFSLRMRRIVSDGTSQHNPYLVSIQDPSWWEISGMLGTVASSAPRPITVLPHLMGLQHISIFTWMARHLVRSQLHPPPAHIWFRHRNSSGQLQQTIAP